MRENHFVGEIRDGVAWATLNRPDSYNAWDQNMREGLAAFLLECQGRRDVRCFILSGAGKHFMAGGDVKLFGTKMDLPAEERAAYFSSAVRDVNPVIESLRRCTFPTLAVVRGACAGFGLSFMLNCDMAIAADDAHFTFAYTKIGATPDGGASYYLPRVVGIRQAMQIALLSDRIPAKQAELFGLVNWVVPEAELDSRAEALARRLVDGASGALARTKKLLRESLDTDFSAALENEAVAFGECAAGLELGEGVTAFLEKRSPQFR